MQRILQCMCEWSVQQLSWLGVQDHPYLMLCTVCDSLMKRGG